MCDFYVYIFILEQCIAFRIELSVISVRIPKKLKEEMMKLNINWSEYIRNAIKEEIRRNKLLEASKGIDKIREKTKHGIFNSVKAIREDRER